MSSPPATARLSLSMAAKASSLASNARISARSFSVGIGSLMPANTSPASTMWTPWSAHRDTTIPAAHIVSGSSAMERWGHCSFDQAMEVPEMAGVKRLALTHHDPEHDNEFFDHIE